MFSQREANPHFLPRHHDPVIEFGPGPQQSRPLPPHGSRPQPTHTLIEPTHGPRPQSTGTSIVPPHGPRPQSTRTSIVPPHVLRPEPTHTSIGPPHVLRPEPTHTSIEPPHGPRSQRSHTPIEPSHGPRSQHSRTPIEPSHGPRTQPQPKLQIETPPRVHKEPMLHPTPHGHSHPHGGRDTHSHPHGRTHRHNNQHGGRAHHHGSSLLRAPTSRRTKPLAWLVAVFCALFWIIVIVGGLIILTIYLVFRPKNPRFDINGVSLNAAYLDMGYLLNGDITVLANFTNPNTKVNVAFTYVIFELHYRNNFIATHYIEPFSVLRRESRFIGVHLVSSQVRLSAADSLELQREMERGRVNLELKGMFRTRSKLGGIFQYSYWLHTRCQLLLTGPPTGVLIGKRCTTK